MNIYPHFRILRWTRPHQTWMLELSVEAERRTWSIPHGPVLHPRERHLALELPGAEHAVHGTADCWDAGPTEIRKWTRGHIVVVLHGAKLRGCYSLVRFRRNSHARWLWVRVNSRMRHPRGTPLMANAVTS